MAAPSRNKQHPAAACMHGMAWHGAAWHGVACHGGTPAPHTIRLHCRWCARRTAPASMPATRSCRLSTARCGRSYDASYGGRRELSCLPMYVQPTPLGMPGVQARPQQQADIRLAYGSLLEQASPAGGLPLQDHLLCGPGQGHHPHPHLLHRRVVQPRLPLAVLALSAPQARTRGEGQQGLGQSFEPHSSQAHALCSVPACLPSLAAAMGQPACSQGPDLLAPTGTDNLVCCVLPLSHTCRRWGTSCSPAWQTPHLPPPT